jgi:hypothetical protein
LFAQNTEIKMLFKAFITDSPLLSFSGRSHTNLGKMSIATNTKLFPRLYFENFVIYIKSTSHWSSIPITTTLFLLNKGQEFRSRLVESLLRQRRIEHLFAQNTEIKANYVERVIKIIKSKMYRYFTHAQSYNYIEELQNFAGSCNKTYHRTIGMQSYFHDYILKILSYTLNLHPIGRLYQSQQLCFF